VKVAGQLHAVMGVLLRKVSQPLKGQSSEILFPFLVYMDRPRPEYETFPVFNFLEPPQI
jgi:hypothetical protein